MSSKDKQTADFASFVEHPRFGRGPRFTGLNPVPGTPKSGAPAVHLHWWSVEASRIADTAIEADVSKQKASGSTWPTAAST